ncbi:MAG: SBBP repeat-containing protein, partial [Candidatus Sulfotelmatobacter sp.]
ASSAAQLAAADLQHGKINYLLGNDPAKWRSNIPLFGRVSYRNLYPGVDLVFHGASKQLEFDYLVQAGADAKSIALGFEGADKVALNANGDLVLQTAAGPVKMHRPVAYQESNGARQPVEARFTVKSAHEVAFALGPYDHSRELVIDPTVTYSTYVGGDLADYGLAVAVDGSGNAFIAGSTQSDVFLGGAGSADGSFDAFITKLDPAGALVFVSLFGGTGDEFPGGIAVDSAGIYVAGTTSSPGLATVGAAQANFLGGSSFGDNDAFAAKFDLLTGTLTWFTYIAGSDSDSGLAVAVDGSHNVYVAGETFSVDLGCAVASGSACLHSPLPSGNALNLGLGAAGGDDGYIAKINSTGTAYSLLSYIGGSNGDLATGVALDGSGNIYVSGLTVSTDLPSTPGVVQPLCGTDGSCNSGFDDSFVVAIQANLLNYKYVTYYGGSNLDDAFWITADATGDAFITGTTASSDFPTVSAFQSGLAGAQNAFVVELNPTGTAATYSTYLGGNGTDFGDSIAIDGSGNAYVTGQTSSSNFPLVNPTQATLSGSTDAFVSVLSPGQGTALFSTYLGGGGDENQLGFDGIAVDSSENIYVTGDTDSGNGTTAAFPTTNPLDGVYGGGTCPSGTPCTDAFVAAYSPATAPDFTITAGALIPGSVSPGGSATSTVTVTALNGYSDTVNLTCSVAGSGSPLPACSLNGTSTSGSGSSVLTVTTTGTQAALSHKPTFFYAAWLPILGFSTLGVSFISVGSRRKRLLGFLMVAAVMASLFLMPACSSSSSTTITGGCTGCTPAGNYTVTITGTGTDSASTTHSTPVTLTVN